MGLFHRLSQGANFTRTPARGSSCPQTKRGPGPSCNPVESVDLCWKLASPGWIEARCITNGRSLRKMSHTLFAPLQSKVEPSKGSPRDAWTLRDRRGVIVGGDEQSVGRLALKGRRRQQGEPTWRTHAWSGTGRHENLVIFFKQKIKFIFRKMWFPSSELLICSSKLLTFSSESLTSSVDFLVKILSSHQRYWLSHETCDFIMKSRNWLHLVTSKLSLFFPKLVRFSSWLVIRLLVTV